MSKHSIQPKVYIPAIFALAIVTALSIYTSTHKNNLKNVEVKKPALVIDTIKEEPIGELLGRASVSFAGGTEERNKNIELGVSKLNGKTILPGEEFSFIKFLGSVTEEDGYSVAKVFLNGEVTTGVGGGLCQVSTTLFQSALKAGLPITERHNHSYTVSYYDVGMDATYSDPGVDLRFVNDTGNPITIKGKTEDQKVVFEIYGTKDGRIATTTDPIISNVVDVPPARYVATTTRSSSEPECINKPQIGYTSEVIYNVLYPNGDFKTEQFKSRYKPLQKVCFYYGIPTTTPTNFSVR
jgi:vancomycin resistance protein YoaR